MDDVLARVSLIWRNPSSASRVGASAVSGVLIVGGCGSGKSATAHALAVSIGVRIVAPAVADILRGGIGASEKRIRQVFNECRRSAPCVLVLDDLDAIAAPRTFRDDTSGVTERIVATLLNEIDGAAVNAAAPPVFIIATANDTTGIDSALIRPGRLHIVTRVTDPNVSQTADALRAITRATNAVITASECTDADDAIIDRIARRIVQRGGTWSETKHIGATALRMLLTAPPDSARAHIVSAMEAAAVAVAAAATAADTSTSCV